MSSHRRIWLVLFAILLLSKIEPLPAAMSLGFGVRILLHSKDHQSKTVLIPEEVLVSCSPAAYLAFNYIVYGRLLRFNIGSRHSLIRPNWGAAFFVTSDISTFVIQVHRNTFLPDVPILT